MKRTVSAMEARKRFGELLEGVFYRGDEVVIERAGKVMAVLIPKERYRALQEDWQESIAELRELTARAQERNKDVPLDVLEKEVEQAIREARAERRKRE